MKLLLVAVNAKYIHSNLGIYSLKAYADQQLKADAAAGAGCPADAVIELAEYTINHQMEICLQDIYRRRPDVIGFSCYIWNIEVIRALAADIQKVLPEVPIWFGGPEVSYDAEKVLREEPAVTGIMKGEGEETFAQLARYYVDNYSENEGNGGSTKFHEPAEPPAPHNLTNIKGLTFRNLDGTITDTGFRPVMDLSRIPFSYDCLRLEDLEHRIIYYESSRGCPFSCSYCLSSIDKQVRFRDLELVKRELQYFLDAGVPQVKFVDRTFNCKKSHAMAIWSYIQEHDNGTTNFHFEIAADLLGEEEMGLLARMRPGLVQLEIGVQTTNVKTLEAIRRKTDLSEIRRITAGINAGRNVHQHLDLIAGLPLEGMDSFRQSFNDVYAMEPEQLQLGFLKVLKGSYMEEMAPAYGLVYSSRPPYEVLSTRWLPYDGILELKEVEDMVEVYYNSRQFTCTLPYLEKEFSAPYDMFFTMGEYYRKHKLSGINHSRIARYEILFTIIEEHLGKCFRQGEELRSGSVSNEPPKQCAANSPRAPLETYRDLLMTDLYLRENVKSRPTFARDQNPYKTRIKDFFIREEKEPQYLKGYDGYDSRQISKMAHIEVMADGTMILFDYKNRDPLTHNARAFMIQEQIENKNTNI